MSNNYIPVIRALFDLPENLIELEITALVMHQIRIDYKYYCGKSNQILTCTKYF